MPSCKMHAERSNQYDVPVQTNQFAIKKKFLLKFRSNVEI